MTREPYKTRKQIADAEFRDALEAHQRQQNTRQPIASRTPAPQSVVKVSVDMRLTGADLALLTGEQVQAVFEGVGRLAALGVTR